VPLADRAEPENASVSPTAHAVPAAGVAIVASGGTPAWTVTVAMSSRPLGSRTRSRARYVPDAA
jgi:hypothetical protein